MPIKPRRHSNDLCIDIETDFSDNNQYMKRSKGNPQDFIKTLTMIRQPKPRVQTRLGSKLGGAPVRTGSQHRLASVGRLVGWLDCWSAAPGLAPGLAPAVWLTPGGTGIGTGCIGRSRLAPGLAPAGIASAGIGCIGRSHAHTRAGACTAARPPARPHSRSRR